MATNVDINHHFNGARGWFKGRRYWNPTLQDAEKGAKLAPVPQHFHRDVLKRETWRPKDLDRYISPHYGKPYHLLVQAAPDAQPQGEWRRRAVGGNAPTLLKVSTWAIGQRTDTIDNIALAVGRSILVAPIILFLVAYPMGSPANSTRGYPAFPSRCYEYPKHALNSLDVAPEAPTVVHGVNKHDKDKLYRVEGEQTRLLRPRALVVWRNNDWEIVDDGSFTGPYIFISFAAAQYQLPAPTPTDPNKTVLDTETIDRRAKMLAKQSGVLAYWADFHCRAEFQPEATDDVHRFCDVVRGAHKICVVLPDTSRNALVFFGQRLWCLPEILLSRNHEVTICTPDPQGPNNTDSMEIIDIMEMTHRAWAVRLEGHRIVSDGNEETFRLLAEHYTGTLKLSRLELIQVALKALRSRQFTKFQQGDLAYALMTLLSKRPRMDPTDTEQQALARLSLANDSDRIVERMACMDQLREPGRLGWFNTTDDLGANLWDIEPLCQVAGVCHDGALILDGCHGISIRWKDIPRIYFEVGQTWKKFWASMSLRSGPFWFLLGCALVGIGGPSRAGGAFFLVLGIILLLLSPYSVAALYGGKVWGAKPWLIGFEGTLPIDEIEYLTFGNSIDERIGADPSLNFPKLPKGHRLFTLIDTGTMTVTCFAAMRPPSVALIAGKEGGMLRAILCSYERSQNCLYKEAVLRMETPMWDRSELMGWQKLA
ncbi:hypothetical protein B7494_g1924 [Chlorociboria aeruginascens]|nr:hypothetical protein B7494_g1924 [Chlorociboria aeruginascens]